MLDKSLKGINSIGITNNIVYKLATSLVVVRIKIYIDKRYKWM